MLEYQLVGQPIALLQLDLQDGDVMEIKHVATHRGSLEAGGSMVEYALNKIAPYNSQRARFAVSAIYLESYNVDSTAASEALGFGHVLRCKPKEMLLDENKSAKWTKVDSKKRLTAKIQEGRTKYLSA